MKFHKLPHLTRDVTGQHYRPVPSDVSLPRLSERGRRLKFRLALVEIAHGYWILFVTCTMGKWNFLRHFRGNLNRGTVTGELFWGQLRVTFGYHNRYGIIGN